MTWINKFLGKIPQWLSSKVSIFIYLFLFFYLVIFAFLCFIVPSMHGLAPSESAQLVLGNYTNVLSALGASIAAGSGVAIHSKINTLHESHQKLQNRIEELHDKIDKLSGGSKAGGMPGKAKEESVHKPRKPYQAAPKEQSRESLKEQPRKLRKDSSTEPQKTGK